MAKVPDEQRTISLGGIGFGEAFIGLGKSAVGCWWCLDIDFTRGCKIVDKHQSSLKGRQDGMGAFLERQTPLQQR